MNKKERVLASINHKKIDKIPIMYRATPPIHEKLLRYFGLKDIKKDWLKLRDYLGVDIFSSGSSLGEFTRYRPTYTGPKESHPMDGEYMFLWDVKGYYDERAGAFNYYKDSPLKNAESVFDIEKFPEPKISDFDIQSLKTDKDLKDDSFLCTGIANSIFMTSGYLRGIENLYMDMLVNKPLAKALVNKVARFAFELNKSVLEKIGNEIDSFGITDDLAGQTGLIISKKLIEEYFLPWYILFVQEAKKYNLKVLFHCCGSINELIPYLIDIGVDILDPVQTFAKDMSIDILKKRYGKKICFHGGIDAQIMLTQSTPKKIKEYVKYVKDLYGEEGGIILGPSHRITPDTPIENILAYMKLNN